MSRYRHGRAPRTAQWKANLSAAMKRSHARANVRARISAAVKRAWQDPELRAKMSAAQELPPPDPGKCIVCRRPWPKDRRRVCDTCLARREDPAALRRAGARMSRLPEENVL